MSDLIQYEDNPFNGGVSKRGDPKSAEEEISESEDEVDADFIRNAKTVVAPSVDSFDARVPPRAAPARLTFHLPDAKDTQDSEEDPSPGTTQPLNKCEQLLDAADPPVAFEVRNEAG